MKSMNISAKILALLCLILSSAAGHAQIWSESFETDGEGTTYTSSNSFNDGSSDHYSRTDGSDVSGGYSGQDGTFFWAAEDWDDGGGDGLSVKTLTFSSVDITGATALQFRGLFATGDVDNGWDSNDTLRVEYSIDGGSFTPLLVFSSTAPATTNGGLYLDNDDDGTGDVQLTSTFSLITRDISETGTSLVIRVYCDSPQVSGNESFAFDLLEVYNNDVAVDGCTDPLADNFDPAATNDDGSCVIAGCTDVNALNYDPTATDDDGSCVLTLPNLVINEIHYNGNDAGGFPDAEVEFIEIFNNEGAAVDLSNYSFDGVDVTFPLGTSMADGEYLIVAIDPASSLFVGATYQIFAFTGAASNGGEALQLLDPNGLVVDEVSYSDGTPWPTAADGDGPSLELINVDFDNNDGNSWCASGVNNGTPGVQNSCAASEILGCTDATALNFNPAATQDDGSCVFNVPAIVINEIHYNPCTDQGDDTLYEFIELYNNDANPVDLSDWSFADGVVFTFPQGTSIAAGEYIIVTVLAATYAGNGYQVFEWTDGGVNNSGEPVTLVDASSTIIDQVSYSDGSPWPNADGNCSSLELMDVNTDNSDPANWQSSYTPNGTPGAENSTLPAATEYTIVEIQSEDHTGESVSTSGVVTAVYPTSNAYTIQDGTGPFSGVWVAGSGVAIGDEVEVIGQVVENFNNTTINAETINVLTQGNTLPMAESLSTLVAYDEQWEGVLLVVLGAVPVGGGDAGFGEWSIDDGSGALLVDDRGYLFAPAPEEITFQVTGPLDFTFGNYKMQPRDENDVVRYGCTDNTFPNFDPLALIDDGSCANISGCTDPNANNFDPAATVDDGSCIVEGCTDDAALNYDPTATVDDTSCYFTEPVLVINEIHYNPCTAQGDDFVYEFLEIYNADAITVDISSFVLSYNGLAMITFPEGSTIAPGEYIIAAITAATYEGNGYQVFEISMGNFGNGGASVQLDDAFGNIIDVVNYDDGGAYPTAPDGDCPSLELIDSLSNNDDGANWQASFIDNGTPGAENSSVPSGCTDENASNYDPTAIEDDGSCVFEGCTDVDALNYDPNATTDDGSCELPGCTYDLASNYDATATVDDGSCTFEINNCPADFNSDGFVNASDLLLFLGDFGNACD
jgi:hypothetical protein